MTDLNDAQVHDPFAPVVQIGGTPVTTHDHICVFFRGREERDRLLLPYLREGLHAGHACVCATTDGESADLVALVAEPDLDTGLLHAVEPKDSYLKHGAFSPEAMLEQLDGWSTRSFVEQGRPFGRAVGDMSWIEPLISPGFMADLLSYESRVTGWLEANPAVGLCLYDLDLFITADVLMPVIKGHPKVWLDGIIIPNPYYLRPGQHDTALEHSGRP